MNGVCRPLLELTEAGLYCAAGGFHIDPERRVERAVITHAHSDHARPGSGAYLSSSTGAALLRERLNKNARIESLPFGQTLRHGDVTISLHPAGHILGSAQVRVECGGEVWVVSGDYKNERDATCEHFEPVPCHQFITESTFGNPFYRWPSQAEVFSQINEWWRENAGRGLISVICAYSLGKTQRLLAGVDAGIGPIVLHPQGKIFLPAYQAAGVQFPRLAERAEPGSLVIVPSIGMAVRDLTGSHTIGTGFASGWMLLPSAVRQYGVSRGFVLSDHADWCGLTDTIRATGAERVGVTHGDPRHLLRWLREQGLKGWSATLRKTGGQLEFGFAED